MIKFEDVTKKFGSITALESISFDVNDGEFVFITGASGAGKSSILKLILREYLPTGGKVVVGEKDICKIPGKKICHYRREIGVVFQDFKLLTEKTVWENVALPLEIRKKSQKEISSLVENVLKSVGLWERRDLFPSQLAGGELQRTSLARAIVTEPKILLADEPTGNLDPLTSKQLVKLIKEVNEKGTTVLMATHNVEIVNLAKERVIELDKGKIISDQKKGKYRIKEENVENDNPKD